MSCTRPLTAYRSQGGQISFRKTDGWSDRQLTLPCGQCQDCRLSKRREWAVRIVHEASLYEKNCFLTLTYDEDHLPKDGSLHKIHFQRFIRRWRKAWKLKPRELRYFHCGEYGDENRRPHYHAIIFGHDFSEDREFLKNSGDGKLYVSPRLQKLWDYGFHANGS